MCTFLWKWLENARNIASAVCFLLCRYCACGCGRVAVRLSQFHSDQPRAGRPRNRASIAGKRKRFSSTAFKPALGPTKFFGNTSINSKILAGNNNRSLVKRFRRRKQTVRKIVSWRATRTGSVPAIAYWLRHYATNRKVTGSIPDEVTFSNLPNPSGRTRPWSSLSL
jgi:hypothetical protein